MFGFLAIAFVVAPLAAIAAWLYRRGRLRLLLMESVLVAVGVWLIVVLIALTGWRDLDGAIDCRPYCTTGQDAVTVVFWAAPLAAIVLAFVSVASLLRR